MGAVKQGPSRRAEAFVAIFLPEGCREEVLGDLYERYRSPAQYAGDAAATVPLVIASRIRRASDLQLLLIEAAAMYISYLSVAWYIDEAFLTAHRGTLLLVIPTVITLA